MARKFFPKALSVGLSLALCASMVAPSFAASFQDLNNAISSNSVGEKLENNRYGYAKNKDGGYGIEAWTDEKGTRNVQLNEDVIYAGEGDATTISVKKNVSLDLNEKTIDGGYRAEETDEDGKVTQEAVEGSKNSVITVERPVSAEIKNGTITGGNADNGGGVRVKNNSTVKIDSVDISGNTANNGGGINAGSGTDVTITDSNITGNTASVNSNGVGGGGGGVMASNATVKIEDSVISDNTAKSGGGISAGNSKVSVGGDKGSVVANNSAWAAGDDIVLTSGGTFTMPSISEMKDKNEGELTLKEDGKPITGWYDDIGDPKGNGGVWGNGEKESNYKKYDKVGGEFKGTIYLKAAHDQYFTVSNEDGEELFNVENGTVVSIADFEEPARDGFTFLGWAVNGEPVEGTDLTVNENMTLTARWEENPVPVDPAPVGPGEVEIDDPATPLASGPVTRAQFIDYLWRHEGEPASNGVCTFTDVAGDHEFILALAWAEQNGVAEAYLNAEGHVDGTFEPEELVTVAAVREFLGNFAGVFGTNVVSADALTTLAKDEGEAVLNCDEVLAEFFGEEYVSAKDEDIEIAA